MNGVNLTNPWFRVLLIALGGLSGAMAFLFAPLALISAGLKTAAVLLGTIWVTMMAFALKVADVTEAPGLSPSEHEDLEEKVRCAVQRVWVYAGANAIAALFVLLPSVVIDAKEPLSPWLPILAGAGVGFSVYSIIAHAWWQEELRRFRSKLREKERKIQHAEKMAKLSETSPLSSEVVADINRHNSKGEWASPPAAH
jgi:hypothetical protein